jgi:hypothetical protein
MRNGGIMTADIKIDVERIEIAKEIFSTLSALRPLQSFSFSLDTNGMDALNETLVLIDWGIGGNKPKLKEAALEVVTPLSEREAGSPLNVNLTEYEIKAMEEVASVIARALEQQDDGVLK